MIALYSHAPAGIVAAALLGTVFAVLLAVALGWHALRRLFGIPRVPRGRSTYVLMLVLWGGLIAALGATTMLAFMLQDHAPVDGVTPLAELRCEVSTPGHLGAELTTLPSRALEFYDVPACTVSVVEVELRPWLRPLGVRRLWRVDAVGSSPRPRVTAEWLNPRPGQRRPLMDLLIRGTRNVSLVAPPNAHQRFLIVPSPTGPALELGPA